MPDARLERTRHPVLEVPPCVRLGHEWRWLGHLIAFECIRCGLRVDATRPQPTNAVDPHGQPSGTPSPRVEHSSSAASWNVIEGDPI